MGSSWTSFGTLKSVLVGNESKFKNYIDKVTGDTVKVAMKKTGDFDVFDLNNTFIKTIDKEQLYNDYIFANKMSKAIYVHNKTKQKVKIFRDANGRLFIDNSTRDKKSI